MVKRFFDRVFMTLSYSGFKAETPSEGLKMPIINEKTLHIYAKFELYIENR